MIDAIVLSRMHRTVPCSNCGAVAGHHCRGVRSRVLRLCHVARKRELARWRKENPEAYSKLRERLMREAHALEKVGRRDESQSAV